MAFIGEAEPLLNPAVYDAIVTAQEAGVDVSLGTNGVLFDTGEAGQKALEHLTWIRFNISAASDEAYRRVHGSKEFATAVEKIKFCVDHKRKKDLPVTVGLQMVLIHEDADQVVPLAKLGKELGVDYFEIKQCSDTQDNQLDIYHKLEDYDRFTEDLKTAEAMSDDHYNVIVKWSMIKSEGKRCYSTCLGTPFLLYSSGNGRVYPCGMFFDFREEEFRMGDLTEQSFKEIWESDQYWDVVEKVKKIDVHKECYASCRTHSINDFLWQVMHPPPHINFV
jgi:radical SAM protein with 4Fe4S-binding SPASM domain